MDRGEPTETEIAALRDRQHIPDRQGISAVLGRYFADAIDDATVDRLHVAVQALLVDPDRKSVAQDAFLANGRQYQGQLWKELVSNHRYPASPSELAIWLAVTTPGHPPPRAYCPSELVGIWTQVKPRPATWQLEANGALQTTEPGFLARTRWCVHRKSAPRGGLAGAELRLTSGSEPLPLALTIDELGASVLLAGHGSVDGSVDYRLER